MVEKAQNPMVIFWFRRDLRLNDNVGLARALKSGFPVVPLFIFDSSILRRIQDRDDRRVQFIHQTVAAMDADLRGGGSRLLVEHGDPLEVWKKLVKRHKIAAVYTNRDYEPSAIERDARVAALLKESGAEFYDNKDQVIFEKREIAKDDGLPYTVFTPFSRKWKARLAPTDLKSHDCAAFADAFAKISLLGDGSVPSLQKIGFNVSPETLAFPSMQIAPALIKNYARDRDKPFLRGTSHMGLHLRFGTVSIRDLVRRAKASETWLGELIWREFFMQILWNFPHVANEAFKPDYRVIAFREDKDEFARWCEGRTGYPLVDAGMRELNATGFMHNRVRMVTASFLVKHLLIDWRWGEAYFARHLLDFELASNNGNWQWVAGTGCDAAPYFRVFNPESQQKKFDPDFEYIKKWVPEFGTHEYPEPMIDHTTARTRALRVYKAGLSRKAPPSSKPL